MFVHGCTITQHCTASKDCFFTRVVCQTLPICALARLLLSSKPGVLKCAAVTDRHTSVVRAGAKRCKPCSLRTIPACRAFKRPRCMWKADHMNWNLSLKPTQALLLCSQHVRIVRTAVHNMTQPASSCGLAGPVLDFQIRYLKAAKPFKKRQDLPYQVMSDLRQLL